MAVFFSGYEVLQVAINIEENGIAFYEAMMMNVSRPELKAAFDYLAGQEKIHRQVFSKIQQSAGRSYTVEQYPGEQSSYVKALADSVIFKPGMARDLAGQIKSDDEAMERALGFEKDSILFYSAVLPIVREEDRKVVNQVLDQEKMHVVRIMQLKQMLHSDAVQDYGH